MSNVFYILHILWSKILSDSLQLFYIKQDRLCKMYSQLRMSIAFITCSWLSWPADGTVSQGLRSEWGFVAWHSGIPVTNRSGTCAATSFSFVMEVESASEAFAWFFGAWWVADQKTERHFLLHRLLAWHGSVVKVKWIQGEQNRQAGRKDSSQEYFENE